MPATPRHGAPAGAADDPADASLARWRKAALVAWTFLGCALLMGVLGYLLNVLAVPVSIVIWTAILVFVLRGAVNFFNERLRWSRLASVTCSYVLLAAVLAALVLVMSSPFFGIGDQFTSLVEGIPGYLSSLQGAYADFMAAHPQLAQDPAVEELLQGVTDSVATFANSFMSTSFQSLVGAGTFVGNTIVAVGFALVMAFWLLLSAPAMGREVRRLLGGAHQDELEFFYLTFTRVVGGYIKGTLLQCALIAIAAGIVFLALGVPNALAFAIITGVLNIIPIVGPWLGGAAAALAALAASPLSALLAFVLVIVIQQAVYTFLGPKIMSESVDVHPVLVIMAMMIGLAVGTQLSGTVGGLTGMLLGIPCAAFLKSLFVYYFEKRTGRVIVAEDGVFFKGTPATGGHNPGLDATAPISVERLREILPRIDGDGGPGPS